MIAAPEHRRTGVYAGRYMVTDLMRAMAWREVLRRSDRTLAVTNGCFDVLHAGHVRALLAARREADALLVLVNDDESVRALKGPLRPINGELDRTTVLVALRCVDAVVLFAGTDCAAELTALAPDVYCKSAEYRGRQNRHEAAALAACGTRVVWHDREPGLSTSRIVAVSGGAVCAS